MRSRTIARDCVAVLLAFLATAAAAQHCERTVVVEMVAVEQAIVLNRFGAFNPAGMLYALRRDVVFNSHNQPVFVRLFQKKLPVERLHEAGVDNPDLHPEFRLYLLGGF